MFILVTGKPRSGKSAYAVDFMLKNKSNYFNIYANINGLKMQDNIKPLNFNDLMETVGKCKDIYDHQISNLGNDCDLNTIDEPIVEYLLEVEFIVENPNYDIYLNKVNKRLKENIFKRIFLDRVRPITKQFRYKPTLIIIDEAQNHLPSRDKDTGKNAAVDPIISWWISYHGHLYMDVFLLSQNYHKIHPAYIYDIEYFLNAVSSSKSILGADSPNFVYKHHIATPFHGKNLAAKIKIKKRKEIFAAYESGDKVRTKSIIMPYIYYSLAALVLTAIILKIVISSFSSSDDVEINNELPKNNIEKPNKNTIVNSVRSKKIIVDKNINYSDFTYLKLNCIGSICTNELYKINLDIDDLQDLLENTQSKYLRNKKLSDSMAVVYLLVSPDFIGLFETKERKNEKDNRGFSIIN